MKATGNKPAAAAFGAEQQSTQRESNSGGEVQSAPMRYGFRVGACGFLIGAGVVSEVVLQPTLYPLPMAPQSLAGLLNLRGNIVPVFDLRRHLNPHAAGADISRVLVLDPGPAAAGFAIDGLPQPVPHDAPWVDGGAPEPFAAFLSNGRHFGGCDWWEFDHCALLARLTAGNGA
jgi:hypothetical protein